MGPCFKKLPVSLRDCGINDRCRDTSYQRLRGAEEFISEKNKVKEQLQKGKLVVCFQVPVQEESASNHFSALHQRQLSPLQSQSTGLGSAASVDQSLFGPSKPESGPVW